MKICAGFCLLETTIALTAALMLIVLLTELLSTQITHNNIINQDLSNARQAVILYKLLKNKIQPGCKYTGSKNIVSGNDILNISCCKANTCYHSKIYLSRKALYEKTQHTQPEQIARNICNFSLRYGKIHNNNISYDSHTPKDISMLKANVLLCRQSQTFNTDMEFAL